MLKGARKGEKMRFRDFFRDKGRSAGAPEQKPEPVPVILVKGRFQKTGDILDFISRRIKEIGKDETFDHLDIVRHLAIMVLSGLPLDKLPPKVWQSVEYDSNLMHARDIFQDVEEIIQRASSGDQLEEVYLRAEVAKCLAGRIEAGLWLAISNRDLSRLSRESE